MSTPATARRRPERPGRPPEAALELPARGPTARPATRSSRTSCCTGSRPRSARRRSTGATRSGSARSRRRCSSCSILSGLPLLFLYVPSVERAYQSVKDIEYVVTFGSWIRAVHRISAHLMVVAVVLHLVRVFLTGAYKNGVGPRPAPRVELGDRRRDAAADAVPLVHRLPAAVGPAGLLGGHGRHQHRRRRSRASGPQVRELLIGGRTIEQADADPLLRAARRRPARRCWACSSRTTCGASARTAAWPAPTARRAARAAAEAPAVADQDLHAARRRARHRADDPRRERSRRRDTHGQRRARPRRGAPRSSMLGTIAVDQHPGRRSSRSPLEEPANALVTPNPAKAPWYFLWLQEIVTDTTFTIGGFTVNGAFLGGVILPGPAGRRC